MKSISQVTIGAVYTYTPNVGTRAFPVEVLSRIEGTVTKVLVKDRTVPVPGRVFLAEEGIEFETHIQHLTAEPVDEVRKSWRERSTEKTNFDK